jgi:hypothetical protein
MLRPPEIEWQIVKTAKHDGIFVLALASILTTSSKASDAQSKA